MSDAGLFVGTPPPHSPTPSVASFAKFNPMNGRTSGYTGPLATMGFGADFQETAQAQAPSYPSAIPTGQTSNGDQHERQAPVGSISGGTNDNAGHSNSYHNASTPYYFGRSPGDDAAGTYDAEAVREYIYRQIKEEEAQEARRNLEVRLHAASQPNFADLNGYSSQQISQPNAMVQHGQSFARLHNMSTENSRIIGAPHSHGYVMRSPGMASQPEVHHNHSTFDTSRDPRRRNRSQRMPSPHYPMPLPVHHEQFGPHLHLPEHTMGDGQFASDENSLLDSNHTHMPESEDQRHFDAAHSLASMSASIATVDAPVPNFDSGPNFGSMGGPVRQFAARQARMIAPAHDFENSLPSPRGLRRTFQDYRDNSDHDDYERVSSGNPHSGSSLSRSTGRSVSSRNAQGNVAQDNVAPGYDFSDAVDMESTMPGNKTPGGRTPATANTKGRASSRKVTAAKDVATKPSTKQTQARKAPVKKTPAKKTSTGKAPGNNIPADTTSGAQTPGNMTMGGGPSGGKTPGPASLPSEDTLVVGRKRRASNMSGGPATQAPAAKKRVTKKSSTQAAAPVVETPEAVETPEPAETAEASNAAQTPATKRRGRAPAKAGVIVDNRALPRSFAECDEADKALVEMKERGESWAAIKQRYAEISGVTHARSTLPNRYIRLKSKFFNIKDEDKHLLLEAKLEIETEFEAQKWQSIAQRITDNGGGTYDPVALQREYKKAMMLQGMDVNTGLATQDGDFAGPDVEDDDADAEADDDN